MLVTSIDDEFRKAPKKTAAGDEIKWERPNPDPCCDTLLPLHPYVERDGLKIPIGIGRNLWGIGPSKPPKET